MIISCPECTGPFELADDQIAELVQIECPNCGFRMILDFAAANDPSLVEDEMRIASGFRSAADYYASIAPPKPVVEEAPPLIAVPTPEPEEEVAEDTSSEPEVAASGRAQDITDIPLEGAETDDLGVDLTDDADGEDTIAAVPSGDSDETISAIRRPPQAPPPPAASTLGPPMPPPASGLEPPPERPLEVEQGRPQDTIIGIPPEEASLAFDDDLDDDDEPPTIIRSSAELRLPEEPTNEVVPEADLSADLPTQSKSLPTPPDFADSGSKPPSKTLMGIPTPPLPPPEPETAHEASSGPPELELGGEPERKAPHSPPPFATSKGIEREEAPLATGSEPSLAETSSDNLPVESTSRRRPVVALTIFAILALIVLALVGISASQYGTPDPRPLLQDLLRGGSN